MRRLLSITLLAMALAADAALAFDLQGHRGARGLAPENTLEGFAVALSVGVSTLELDLGMTKDGVVVVHHDLWLNPDTTRGPDGAFLTQRGPAIRALTLAELQRYDVGRLKPGVGYSAFFSAQRPFDGARAPTLAQVFELVQRAKADHVRFNIETKLAPDAGVEAPDPETFAAAVSKAIIDAGVAARTSVQSFDWRTLAVLRRIVPEIERVCLTLERGDSNNVRPGQPGRSLWTGFDIAEFGGSTPRLVQAAGCAGWSPLFRDLTAASLKEARSLGLKSVPWTVNERADMERLIDLGVDGLITDYPDRLRAVMKAKQLPLPPTVSVP